MATAREGGQTLRVSALLPGLSITPADIAGLPAESEMAALISDVEPQVALQPVVSLATGEVQGQEALSRFGSRVPTERWFRGAALHGLGADLERVTLRASLGSLDRIPDGQFLAVNVSPASLYDVEVIRLLHETDLSRLVIEVTEHDAINDYEDTRRYLARLRLRGARIAVDDVGAGYASLKHLLLLQPDMIKLDTSLTRDVHKSPKQQSMVRCTGQFANEVGAIVLAEGVEIAEQIPPLLEAGVPSVRAGTSACPSSPRADGVAGAGEVAVADDLLQAQLHPPGQERRTSSERDRGVLDPQLVEQPRVDELTREVAPSDNPDPALARSFLDLSEGSGDVATDQLHVVTDPGQVTGREHPGRLLVGPGGRWLGVHLVLEQPLVGRRPHHQCTDVLLQEVLVAHRPTDVDVAREQPLQ